MTATTQAVFSHRYRGLRALPRSAACTVALALGMALTAPATLAWDASTTEGQDLVMALEIPYGTDGESYRWSWKTEDDTATSGADYTSKSGTVTFTYDDDKQYIKVKTLLDCDMNETAEYFNLKFSDFQVKNSRTDGWRSPSWSFSDPNWGSTFTRQARIKNRYSMTNKQKEQAGCS